MGDNRRSGIVRPKYSHWMRRDDWNLGETFLLLLDCEPTKYKDTDFSAEADERLKSDEARELLDLLENGPFKDDYYGPEIRHSPKYIILWAKSKDVTVPEGLFSIAKEKGWLEELTPKQQSAKLPHGNTEINAVKREEVLKACFGLLGNFPEQFKKGNGISVSSLVKMIEVNGGLYWPKTGGSPLSFVVMEELVSSSMRLTKKIKEKLVWPISVKKK